MNNKETMDTLLDIYEGNSSVSRDAISDILSDDKSAGDLQRLQILDEAANLKWRKNVDVDAELAKFESHRKNAPKPVWKTVPGGIVTLAAASVLFGIWFVTREQLFDSNRISNISITHYADVRKVTKENEKAVKKTVVVGNSRMNEVTVDGKRMLCMTLADGTRVWLNANSCLRYADTFSKNNRKVELDGEAFFDVSHDSDHPFIIKAKNVTTKVLGTKLNVRCYDANDIHVTLVEGRVEVQSPKGNVTISPDQDTSFVDHALNVRDVNTRDFTCWREGVMYFDDATLRTILKQISAWYGVNVVCRDDALLDKHFHYVCRLNEPLKEAIAILNESSNVGIVVKDGSILIE